jgi:hypothetical protein
MAKVFTGQPKKANKPQKAEIIKQLLALSERESRISASASSVRTRAPLYNQGTRPGNAPRKTASRRNEGSHDLLAGRSQQTNIAAGVGPALSQVGTRKTILIRG